MRKITITDKASGKLGQVGVTFNLLKSYEPQYAICLQNDFTIHHLNFAGHSGSESNEVLSISLFAKQTTLYIQQNNLAPVSVLGYSMGGYVAAYVAVHHPQLITCICTLATKFHWDATIAAKEIKMLEGYNKNCRETTRIYYGAARAPRTRRLENGITKKLSCCLQWVKHNP